MENEIYRGDIFYIDYGQYTGSEQKAGRPGIIVSNDMNNTHSSTVEVVYLTTQPKENLPTHVIIRSTKKISTALCEQITTVSKERIGNYIASCTEFEMDDIDHAIKISLQLCNQEDIGNAEPAITTTDEPQETAKGEETAVDCVDISRIIAERDIYMEMYKRLLAQLTGVNI